MSRKKMVHTAGFEIFVSPVELRPHRKSEYGIQKPEKITSHDAFSGSLILVVWPASIGRPYNQEPEVTNGSCGLYITLKAFELADRPDNDVGNDVNGPLSLKPTFIGVGPLLTTLLPSFLLYHKGR